MTRDPIVNTVIKRMVDRHEQGMVTYGMTMEDNPLSAAQWIDHTIEELLDAACYLERLKKELT